MEIIASLAAEGDSMLPEQEIGRELFGYKKDDVDRLLAELHRSLRLSKEENDKLSHDLTEAVEKLAHYENISDTLKKAMINAEKTASELVEHARNEADYILTKARKEADGLIDSATAEKQAIEMEYAALKKAEDELKAKVQSMLGSYTTLVDKIKPETATLIKNTDSPKIVAEIEVQQPEGERVERKIPKDLEKKLTGHIAPMIGVQGVKNVWIFDDSGAIYASFNRLNLDIQKLTRSLVALEEWAARIKENLDDEQAGLMFVEFKKSLLTFKPITATVTLALLFESSVSMGEIFQSISAQMPKLKKSLSG